MHASRWAPQNNEDAFAQTREPDNLFDDDIVPVSEPIVQQLPVTEQQSHRQTTPNQPRARGNGRGRGRGRGGRNIEQPRRADTATPQSHDSKQSARSQDVGPADNTTETDAIVSTEQKDDASLQNSATADAAASDVTDPSEAPKVQAVRGPRHQTGGVQRPKLTEDELSARMAAAALNNAKREAAHKEAEADAAKFQAREAAAKQRRTQETAARRVMDNERERNRQRKLGAQGVREWDQGKDEEQLHGGQQRRGYRPAGGQTGATGTETTWEHSNEDSNQARGDDDRGGFRGRGRGRGRGQRGRGRGRGAFEGSNVDNTQTPRAAPPLGEDHFPTLTAAPKETNSASTKDSSSTELISTIADKGSWADQVEASQQ